MISCEEHHLLPFFPVFLGLKMLPFSFQILKLNPSLVKMSMNISAGICGRSPYSPVCWEGSVYDISSTTSSVSFPICSIFREESQDQDQDSLLVKRRNDNHLPGPVIRELVPSSHQRSELSNTILCIFSG